MRKVSNVLLMIGVVLSVGAGSSTGSFAEMAKWNTDHDHSTVGFQVSHMVVSKTNGKFSEYAGIVEMNPEAEEFKTIEAVIQTASVTTDHQKRDEHLRSPDFFDVEKFPTMTYTMKSYKKTGDDYTAVGDLTLLGVTKEITLVRTFNGVALDPWGNTRAGLPPQAPLTEKTSG